MQGPLQERQGIYPQSDPIAEAARLPLLPGTRLHAGLLLALVGAVILRYLFRRTLWGFQLQAVGLGPRAAEISGRIDSRRMAATALALSGGIAGLAGGVEVGGVSYALFQNLSPGYGFTAIAVALLGRLEPFGVVLAGLLFGALEAGAGAMQREAGVPAVAVYVVEAVVIVVVLLAEALRRGGSGAIAAIGAESAAGRGGGGGTVMEPVAVFGGFLAAAVRVATPLLLAATGETVVQRSGVMNLGLEGMMLAGALAATLGATCIRSMDRRRPRRPRGRGAGCCLCAGDDRRTRRPGHRRHRAHPRRRRPHRHRLSPGLRSRGRGPRSPDAGADRDPRSLERSGAGTRLLPPAGADVPGRRRRADRLVRALPHSRRPRLAGHRRVRGRRARRRRPPAAGARRRDPRRRGVRRASPGRRSCWRRSARSRSE